MIFNQSNYISNNHLICTNHFYIFRNLICGRLICTYPKQTPYSPPNSSTASVIYAFVRDQVCISVDFGSSVREDPLRVISGSVCDLDRVSHLQPVS